MVPSIVGLMGEYDWNRGGRAASLRNATWLGEMRKPRVWLSRPIKRRLHADAAAAIDLLLRRERIRASRVVWADRTIYDQFSQPVRAAGPYATKGF